MGRELQWNPIKKQWDIWSSVTCSFVDTAKSPEEVADKIIDRDYYLGEKAPDGREIIAVAEFKSREEIIDKLTRNISEAKDSCWQELTKEGWERKCLPADQVKRNLQSVLDRTLERWDKGEIKPDPKAKEELRNYWIQDAINARKENRRVSLVCELKITPSGAEVTKLWPPE